MTWALVIGIGWLLLAGLVAVTVGRAIRRADVGGRRDAFPDEPNFVVDPLGSAHPATIPFPAVTRLPTKDAGRTKAQPPAPPPSAPPSPGAPTIPGLPVARPPVPGAADADGDQTPETGTG